MKAKQPIVHETRRGLLTYKGRTFGMKVVCRKGRKLIAPYAKQELKPHRWLVHRGELVMCSRGYHVWVDGMRVHGMLKEFDDRNAQLWLAEVKGVQRPYWPGTDIYTNYGKAVCRQMKLVCRVRVPKGFYLYSALKEACKRAILREYRTARRV